MVNSEVAGQQCVVEGTVTDLSSFELPQEVGDRASGNSARSVRPTSARPIRPISVNAARPVSKALVRGFLGLVNFTIVLSHMERIYFTTSTSSPPTPKRDPES